MTEISVSNDRRAQSVAGFGLAVQVLMLGLVIGVCAWDRSTALALAGWHLAGGIPIWLTLLLIYTQRKRSQMETLETDALRQERGTASERLFDPNDETLLVERRKLKSLMRWSIPVLTLLLVVYHFAAIWLWYSFGLRPINDPSWLRSSEPSHVAWFVGGVAVFSFLLSRYAGGMARRPEWRLLRAAGAYLMGNALGTLALVIALGMSIYEVPWGEPIAAYFIGIMMLLLGVEFLVNLLLDLYRPRVPGQEARPAFDSRLLGLLVEPGGIARSIAEAVNYQFGFEVSRTWFYQLLQRSVVWLLLFVCVVLWGLSAILVVDSDEQAVVERFGRRATGSDQVLEPGLHFKLPWPFEIAYRAPVRRLQTVDVGDLDQGGKKQDQHDDEGHAILWTDDHKLSEETMLLVAGPKGAGSTIRSAPGQGTNEAKGVSLALMHASVVVQYRVSDILDYLYTYKNPERVMEDIVRRTLSEFAAGTELSVLMGVGREQFNRRISEALQTEVDQRGLGIEIAFVALQDAHPPSNDQVAKTFQEVVAAERRKEAAIEEAHGQAQQIKTRTAGSVTLADALNAAIVEMDRLASDPKADPAARALAESRVSAFFLPPKAMTGSTEDPPVGTTKPDGEDSLSSRSSLAGEAAKLISQARAEAIAQVSETASKVHVLDNDRAFAQAAPELFKMRKYLDMLTESVADIRKFIVRDSTNIVIILERDETTEFDFSDFEPTGSVEVTR